MEGLGVDWSTERPRRPWQIAQHKRPLLVLLKEGMRAEVGEGRELQGHGVRLSNSGALGSL